MTNFSGVNKMTKTIFRFVWWLLLYILQNVWFIRTWMYLQECDAKLAKSKHERMLVASYNIDTWQYNRDLQHRNIAITHEKWQKQQYLNMANLAR